MGLIFEALTCDGSCLQDILGQVLQILLKSKLLVSEVQRTFVATINCFFLFLCNWKGWELEGPWRFNLICIVIFYDSYVFTFRPRFSLCMLLLWSNNIHSIERSQWQRCTQILGNKNSSGFCHSLFLTLLAALLTCLWWSSRLKQLVIFQPFPSTSGASRRHCSSQNRYHILPLNPKGAC